MDKITAILLSDFEEYKKVFPTRFKRVREKWVAYKVFQDNFDVGSKDLASNLEKSLTEGSILSDLKDSKEMLVQLATVNPEKLRNALRVLFDENKPLDFRLSFYLVGCDVIKDEMNKIYDEYHDYSGQTVESAADLLALRYPMTYTPYRNWIIKNVVEEIDQYLEDGNDSTTYDTSNKIINILSNLMMESDPKFIEYFDNLMKEQKDCYPDPFHLILASDFALFIANDVRKRKEDRRVMNEKFDRAKELDFDDDDKEEDYVKIEEDFDNNFIFFSYAHEDKDIAIPVIDALKAKYNLWFDDGIFFGSDYTKVIIDHINKCALFVYLVTRNSLKSEYCAKEIKQAERKKKPFINIIGEKGILEEKIAEEFVFEYDHYQRCELDKYDNIEAAIRDIEIRCPDIKKTLK